MSDPAWILLIAITPLAIVVVVAMLRGYTIRVSLERNGHRHD